MKIKILLTSFLFSAFLLTTPVRAKEITPEKIFDMPLEDLMDINISIASLKPQNISRAPSIVTIITDKEIREMGFLDIMELLRTVPGVDITKDGQFGRLVLAFRGTNERRQVKILLNGHSLNRFRAGHSAGLLSNLPLKFVKRIEIIRGPGSALYGENAFVGVIDIITKDAEDIEGGELYAGFGSYNAKQGGFLASKRFEDTDVAVLFNWYDTDGLSKTIEEDRMSGIDTKQSAAAQALGISYTPSSMAPGDTIDDKDSLDVFVTITHKQLKLSTSYRNYDRAPFIGVFHSLAPTEDHYTNHDEFMIDLSYDNYAITENITIKPKIFYDWHYEKFGLSQFPPGTTLLSTPSGSQFYPVGVKAVLVSKDQTAGTDIQLNYQLLDNYNITLGGFYQWQSMGDTSYLSSWQPNTSESFGGEVEEITSTRGIAWIEDYTRNTFSAYMEHMWDVNQDMSLTLGVRHDHYDDFGDTTNPRAAFVWEFLENLTFKALYGQAFRAPNVQALAVKNNQVFAGNKDLDPETIKTYETGLAYQFMEKSNVAVNWFYSEIRDRITTKSVPGEAWRKYTNSGGLNIWGVEAEFKVNLESMAPGSYLWGNYSFVSPEIDGSSQKEPEVPFHKGNIGINIGLWKYLDANLHTFVIGSRNRAAGDARDAAPGYSVTNLHLLSRDLYKGLQVSLKINNIFNKDYVDPSPKSSMPVDLPRPGRNVFFEVSHKF